MSDYFPRRSACGQERPCAGPSPCLLMPERTSRPAQYRRGAGQGLAALRNFNSAYVADGSDYDLAFWALMSALTSCGHTSGVRLLCQLSFEHTLRLLQFEGEAHLVEAACRHL